MVKLLEDKTDLFSNIDTDLLLTYAAWSGNLNMLLYIEDKYECEISYRTLFHCVIKDSLECLKYCINKYTFEDTWCSAVKSDIVRMATIRESYDCLEYLLDNTQEGDAKLYILLQQNKNLEKEDYIINKYIKDPSTWMNNIPRNYMDLKYYNFNI